MNEDFNTATKATERALLLIAFAFRLAGLIDLVTWYPLDLEPSWASPALMSVLAVESAVVFLLYRRRGSVGPGWLAVGDLTFIIGVMFADVALTGNSETHEWGNWIRNFAIASLVGIAIGLYRWWAALAAVACVSGTYWLCTTLVGGHDEYMIYRLLSALIDGVGGFTVARLLRPRAAMADAAHLRALKAEAALERERERTARAAMLHDRILQTLEVLAAGDAVADRELRGHVAASAGWLRTFVQDGAAEPADGLVSALGDAISDVTRLHGLKVDFHGGQLRAIDNTTPPAIVAAVAGCVRELLTNVAKHSGVPLAVVHCEVDDGALLVSVVDQGRGFDPEELHQGIGLCRSVRARIAEVGGSTLVHAAPGAGTQVEISVPLSG